MSTIDEPDTKKPKLIVDNSNAPAASAGETQPDSENLMSLSPAQLVALLAAEKAAHQKEKADHQKEKAALQKEIEEKDVVIEEKDVVIAAVIKEKNSVIAEMATRSLRTFLATSEEFNFVSTGTETANLNPSDHVAATYVRKHFPLYSRTDLLQQLLHYEDGDRPSLFLTHYLNKPGQPAEISTLVTVAHYVSFAVKDAVKIVSAITGLKLKTLWERREEFFRPDVIVVERAETALPILAVEVKKPAPGEKTTLTHKTAGQAYDYLMMIRSQGQDDPVVVLASLEETYVFWLEQDNALASEEKTLLLNGRVQGSTIYSQPPPGEQNRGTLAQCNETTGLFTPYPERKVMVSSVRYGSQDLLLVLCSAIECGLQCKANRFFPSMRNGPFKIPSMCLYWKSYVWGDLSVVPGQPIIYQSPSISPVSNAPDAVAQEIGVDKVIDVEYPWYVEGLDYTQMAPLRTKPKPGTKIVAKEQKGPTNRSLRFYTLGNIGDGRTSMVLYALDKNGAECAIKVYSLRRKAGNTSYITTINEYRKVASLKIRGEKRNAHFIYWDDKDLKQDFRVLKLNKIFCLVMPFFRPIEVDERKEIARNLDELEKIKEVYRKFLNRGKKYSDQDIHWRHIGRHPFRKGEFVLLDMGDLEDVDKNADKESIIDAFIQTLTDLA